MSATMDDSAIALDAEEQARANVYALLSRLFSAPADGGLLRSIASADQDGEQALEEGSDGFPLAWRNLAMAAGDADAAAVADEYHELFVGSGRSEISLYVGAYTARGSVDAPLVALRAFLASQGLERRTDVHEPEDHFAMLLEVMRYLIREEQSPIAEQRSFFVQFLWSGGVSLCDAISAHPRARFFRSVALFAKSFLLVEHEAFDM